MSFDDMKNYLGEKGATSRDGGDNKKSDDSKTKLEVEELVEKMLKSDDRRSFNGGDLYKSISEGTAKNTDSLVFVYDKEGVDFSGKGRGED